MMYRFEHRLVSPRPDALAGVAIVAAFVAAALIAGIVIATGQPVPILLTLGIITGIALLNALPLVIWIVLVGVLLVSGPVMMFVPALEKAGWLFSLLGIFLTGAAILYSAVGRDRFSRPLPAFVVIAILIFVFGLLSLTYSGGPLIEGIRATKRYFQFFGLLFILAVVPFAPALVRNWWGFLVLLAMLQFPFALYQRLVLVPLREGMPGVVPVDIVVGTMEGYITGAGSSGVMALLLVSIFAYLLAAYREGTLPLGRVVPLAIAVLASLPLGEVKVIVVLLPLAVGAIYVDLIGRYPFRFCLGAALALILVAALGWSYLAINPEPGQSVSDTIEAAIAYNFGDRGYYGGHSLNRTTVLTYWFEQQHLSDPVGALFGHGLGSSFGGVGLPNPGHMHEAHASMYIGLTTASSLLWDLGLIGFLLFMGLFLSATHYASRLVDLAQPGFDRALCHTLRALAVMMTAMIFYNDAPITVPSQQVLQAFWLGLIAWRWRSAGRNNKTAGGSHVA